MLKKGGNYILVIKIGLILLFAGIGFLYWRNYAARSENLTEVIINEIAWMGTVNSANDEWIELYNSSQNEINIDGWSLVAEDGQPTINLTGTIEADGYFLLERSDDESVASVTADVIYTGALGNNGEVLELKDDQGNVVDRVDMGDGWEAGDNSTKQTMERDQKGGWQTSAEIGGTPGALNTSVDLTPSPSPIEGEGDQLEDGTDETDGNHEDQGNEGDLVDQTSNQLSNIDGEGEIKKYRLGAVVINEIVSDPSDEDTEWIELFNTLNETVDVTDWIIEDGSGAKTKLIGQIGQNGTDKFLVVVEPKGNLNNKGDIIILRDSEGVLIDQVAYGDWDDGNLDNNAPVTDDPYSIARKIDGLNSYNNYEDFAITTTVTKGEGNAITSEGDRGNLGDREDGTGYDYSDEVVITEIFPNPAGDDTCCEFIELYNIGERDVDLTSWRLGDDSKKRFEFKSDGTDRTDRTNLIEAGGYFVVYREESGIALNNNGDSVKLYQPLREEPIQVVEYEKVVEGFSYSAKDAKEHQGTPREWVWSEVVTPGEKNVIKEINHLPEVNFICLEEIEIGQPVVFDASDTLDSDGDELSFDWDFGDGHTSELACAEHTYFEAGAQTVRLAVSDGKEEVSEERIIKVTPHPLTPSPPEGGGGPGERSLVYINEFLANPVGSDVEGEWVEIFNQSDSEINLFGWTIDDIDGGSHPFTFSYDVLVEADGYYILERSESGIALNNSSDEVRLINPVDEVIDKVEYDNPGEGEAYARDMNGEWQWTSELTPGGENVIKSPSVAKAMAGKEVSKKNSKEKAIIAVSLDKIQECDIGDLVRASGTVAVLPGILGSQYFYIVGSPGIQVYNYKKDFPDIRIGDVIEVTGEISESGGEKRIKTSGKDDMQILSSGLAPVPISMTCEQITEECVGQLVSVTGEIVERKSSALYLDDGSGEVYAYVKTTTGIVAKNYNEGDSVLLTGIVGRTKSGIRVMPRSSEDIIKKDAESEDTFGPAVLGAFAQSDVWGIPPRSPKLELFQYLLVMAGVVIVVLSGMLVKLTRE